MEPQYQPLVEETVVIYRRYWTALLQAAEPIWSQLDLTILQLKGLILLEARGELAISAIADALAVGRPSASVLVEQMVQMGLVRRSEDVADRRRSLVCLTDQGKDLAARLHRGDEQFMASMFARLDAADLRALEQGLQALTDAMMDGGHG